MQAEIITPWIGDGVTQETARRPEVKDDYPAIGRFVDTTGQPAENLHPAPNLYIINCDLDQTTLDAVEADNKYLVQWYE